MPTVAPYEERLARYNRIMDLRESTDPPMSYERIGEQLDPPLTKQRVQTIIRRGQPRPNGRPPKAE
jgi:hypothetical protein